MDTKYFQELYAYNFWANRQVWECVLKLGQEKLAHDTAYSWGTVKTQLFHMVQVEYWWPKFMREGVLDFLEPADYEDLAGLRAKWDEVEAYVMDYLAAATPAELEREVRPEFWETDRPIKIWQALTQVANHSLDHRAQILAMVHQMGGETVEQDYLNYFWSKGEAI